MKIVSVVHCVNLENSESKQNRTWESNFRRRNVRSQLRGCESLKVEKTESSGDNLWVKQHGNGFSGRAGLRQAWKQHKREPSMCGDVESHKTNNKLFSFSWRKLANKWLRDICRDVFRSLWGRRWGEKGEQRKVHKDVMAYACLFALSVNWW